MIEFAYQYRECTPDEIDPFDFEIDVIPPSWNMPCLFCCSLYL